VRAATAQARTEAHVRGQSPDPGRLAQTPTALTCWDVPELPRVPNLGNLAAGKVSLQTRLPKAARKHRLPTILRPRRTLVPLREGCWHIRPCEPGRPCRRSPRVQHERDLAVGGRKTQTAEEMVRAEVGRAMTKETRPCRTPCDMDPRRTNVGVSGAWAR